MAAAASTPFRYAVLAESGRLDVHTCPNVARDRLMALQTAVRGYIELVPGLPHGLLAFVNEDGNSLGLAPSVPAVIVLRRLGRHERAILGPVAFTGSTRHAGTIDETSLTDEQIDALRNVARDYALG